MNANKNDTCDINYVDKKKVISVKKKMKSERSINLLSETFKALGDPTRIKIIFALSKEELCGCDLSNLLGVTKYTVSHQLRILRNMDLVRYRREGKMVFYTLDDEHIKNLFDEGLKHVEER
jgi:DNA-binding transcriptional ArsR family regulator